jgi:type VI secretion system secreted protein Hcp
VATADIFLSITGPDIKGESVDSKHKDMIEVLSFSWGESNLGTAGMGAGGGSGKVSKQDLTITKFVDKASNNLMYGCASGTHYTKATLWVRKAGGDPLDYLQIDLGPGDAGAVFISSYNVGGAGGDGIIPTETVSINFSTLMMTYNQQAKTGGGAGPAPLGYDFGASKKL